MIGGLWGTVCIANRLRNKKILFRSWSDVSAEYLRIEHIKYDRPDEPDMFANARTRSLRDTINAITIRRIRYKLGLTLPACEPAVLDRLLRHHSTLPQVLFRFGWADRVEKKRRFCSIKALEGLAHRANCVCPRSEIAS
jgi:hypothetical protein